MSEEKSQALNKENCETLQPQEKQICIGDVASEHLQFLLPCKKACEASTREGNHKSARGGYSSCSVLEIQLLPDAASQRTWLKGRMVSGFRAVVIRHVSRSLRVCWAWEARHLLPAETQYTY